MKKVSPQALLKQVIEPNYCSGCGVCTATEDSPFRMQLNEFGQYIPELQGKNAPHVVCPFADHGINENDIASQIFGEYSLNHHPDFGLYKNLYAGYVLKNGFRKRGSSGGSVSWFTQKLLNERMVDYIVHVKEVNQSGVRFQYEISSSFEENKKGAKSKYYPVSLDKVLEFIKNNKGRYAVVGIPCFLKGINLLKQEEKIFKERIKYTISLFCGHLKTTHYLSSLISQFKEKEENVVHFDFRHKIPGRKASDYATKITLKDETEKVKLNKELFGTNWGWGLFKLKACDYCDDIIGETADISFGDAWIKKYENDSMGTNIIVTRNPELDKLISEYDASEIHYEKISADELIESQAGGFRHRREGLAYRLFLKQEKKEIAPVKRVKPEKIKSKKRRKLYKIRMKLQEKSFHSRHYNDPEKLKNELMPFIEKLENLYRHSAYTRFRLWLKSKLEK